MASIGPLQPGQPYLLPPGGGDKRLTKQRRSSYKHAADTEGELGESSSAEEELDAALLARFPPGSGPVNWLARLIFQTYHSILRPKLGRIVDILA